MLVGGLFISCNSEMKQSDTLSGISVSVASEKAIATNGSTLNAINIENLYWYYSATKTSGHFIYGATDFTEVKDEPGLANSNLGDFSNGGWTFVFKGYLNEVESFSDASPVYECTTDINLTANLNLELVLSEGAGMPGNGFGIGTIGLPAQDLANPLTSKLYVYEGENLLLGPLGTFETEGIDQDGKVHFTTDEKITLSLGAHTLTFKATSVDLDQDEVVVGTEDILINVAKGVTQTLGGSFGSGDLQSTITVTAFSHIYKVTFDVNGGDALETSWKNVYEGQTYGELPTPVNGEETFAGWYTAQTGGTLVTAESDIAINDNHTLYAHWGVASNTLAFSLPPGLGAYAKIFVDNVEVTVCEVETAATKWEDLDGQTYEASWNLYSDGEVVDYFTITGFSVLPFNVEGNEMDILSLPSTSTGNGKAYLWVFNESGEPVALDADIDFTKTYYVAPTEHLPVENSITIRTADAEKMVFRVNGKNQTSVEIDIAGATTFGALVGQVCDIAFVFNPGAEDEITYSGSEYVAYGDYFCAMTQAELDGELDESPIPIAVSDTETLNSQNLTPALTTDEIDTSKYYFFVASVG